MPTVNILVEDAVRERAVPITRRYSALSSTKASAGLTTILESGLTRAIFQQAYAMQGAVLREAGSGSMFASGTSGSCPRTRSTYFSEVTIHTFCGLQSAPSPLQKRS